MILFFANPYVIQGFLYFCILNIEKRVNDEICKLPVTESRRN